MSSSVHATNPRHPYVHIESLESRQFLSSVNFYNDSLSIYGDQTDNRVVVQYKPKGAAGLEVVLNGVVYDQPTGDPIDWIDINLGAGNDQVTFKINGPDDLRVYVYARAGNDSISGSPGKDYIYGGDGDDVIFGRAGEDSISGEAGNDVIVGGAGNDEINGRAGSDFLGGGAGDDSLAGSSGNDSIFGGGGADKLVGDADDDLLNGQDGSDIIAGGVGDDHMLGGFGNDQIHGGYGQDILSGGVGSDTLWGGASADKIEGGAFPDTIYRQAGTDHTRLDKSDIVKNEVLTAPLAHKSDAATLKNLLIEAAVRRWRYTLGEQDVPYDAYRYYDRTADGKLFQVDRDTGLPTTNSLLGGGGCSGGGDYSQTNIQEQGVDESDQVKTDGQNIYVLDDNRLIIMAASPAADSHILSTTDIAGQAIGLYLKGNFLTVLSQGEKTVGNCPYNSSEGFKDGDVCEATQTIYQSRVTVHDVSHPTAPLMVEENTFDGTLATSRSIDGKIYLVLTNRLNAPSPKATWHEEASLAPDWKGKTNSWTVEPGIPAYRDYGDKEYLIQAAGYFQYESEAAYRKRLQAMPLEKLSPGYTSTGSSASAASGALLNPNTVYVGPDTLDEYGNLPISSIVSVDPTDGKAGIGSSAAIVGSTGLAYISKDSLYLASSREEDSIEGVESEDRTDLYKFHLGEKNINLVASGQAPGSVLNEFSMDEEDGRLRIATTSGQWDDASNNVMVLGQNGDALEVEGGLTGLASSEQVYSARFEGDRGYLVTFRQVDPLFVIDLSDPINPQIKGELKVPGFSSYLNPIDDHLIIGVGQNAGDTGRRLGLQVSLFDVADSANPTRLQNFTFAPNDDYEWTSSIAETDHHAFAWFPQQQILAIPVSHNSWHGYEAMTYVLKITRSGITLVGTVSQSGYAVRNVRIGSHLYSISSNSIKVVDLDNPANEIATVNLPPGPSDNDNIYPISWD